MKNKIIFIVVAVILIFTLILFLNSNYAKFWEKDKEVGDESLQAGVVDNIMFEKKNNTESGIDNVDEKDDLNGDSAPSLGIALWLVIKNPPSINEVGELEVIMMTIAERDSVNIQIEFPEDILLTEGNLSWYGDVVIPQEELEAHQPPYNLDNPRPIGNVTYKIKFKPLKEGEFVIRGRYNLIKPNTTEIIWRNPYDDVKVYLSVSENNSSVINPRYPFSTGCEHDGTGLCA